MYPFVLLFTISSLLSSNDLQNVLLEIKDNLPVISDNKKIITQDLSFEEDEPYFIIFEQQNEKIKNGDIETETYLLNLALLDPELTEIKTSKKEMKLILKSGTGNFIAYLKDKEAKGYKDKMEILLEDIDLARSLKEKFILAITLAKEEWLKDVNIPEENKALKNWMVNQLKSINRENRTIGQQALSDTILKDYLYISISDDKKEEDIHFSLADLDTSKLKIKNEGSLFSIELPILKGQKLISTNNQKDGLRFRNKFKLYFENASQAKAMAMVLEKGGNSFHLTQNNRIKNYVNCTNCLEQFSKIISSSKTGKSAYEISGDCSAVLIDKKEDKETTYTFEWADIDAKTIQLSFESDLPGVTLTTQGKERFITASIAEKFSYSNNIDIYYDDVESAREAFQILPKIIESCAFNVEIQDPQYIQDHFSSSNPFEDKYMQTLAVEKGEPCTLIFTSHDEKKEKMSEYTFNLYDINPASIKANISKNNLTLQLQTLQKQKVITIVNEKGESKFTDKVGMLFGSVNALRSAKETLIEMVNSCAKD
jgi:hypothetical protein